MNKNMEKAEKQLKNMGYVHPENDNINTISTYSNYNDSGQTYTASSHETYSKYNEFEIKSNLDICPQCNNKTLFICECAEYKDRMCKNKHIWYIDKKGKIIIGDPHNDDDI